MILLFLFLSTLAHAETVHMENGDCISAAHNLFSVVQKLGKNEYEIYSPSEFVHHQGILKTVKRSFSSTGAIDGGNNIGIRATGQRQAELKNGFSVEVTIWKECDL